MIIPNGFRDKLKKNWSYVHVPTEVKAYVRIYDPLSEWECYIIALNPKDEDEVFCLIKGHTVEYISWSLSDIMKMYNYHGDAPVLDDEFIPRKSSVILEKLNDR